MRTSLNAVPELLQQSDYSGRSKPASEDYPQRLPHRDSDEVVGQSADSNTDARLELLFERCLRCSGKPVSPVTSLYWKMRISCVVSSPQTTIWTLAQCRQSLPAWRNSKSSSSLVSNWWSACIGSKGTSLATVTMWLTILRQYLSLQLPSCTELSTCPLLSLRGWNTQTSDTSTSMSVLPE